MRLPWITLGFTAIAAAAGFSPAVVDRLEYRHAAVVAGEWWRPFTAQGVHWSARMSAVDLGAVLVLGGLVERRSRRAALFAIALGIVVTGSGLHLLPPAVERYRGASSVASALFVALALDLGREAPSGALRGAAVAMLALFAAKTAFEGWTGQAIFAGSMGAGVTVLPRAHLLGATGGALGWILGSRTPRRGATPRRARSPG